MAEEAVRWNGTRRASVRNPIQQQRRDLIALETIAIRKHLPNFHGLQYIRSNGQITQEEVLEYQAFSRFIRFSNQTYANTNIAYQAFRQVNNRVYLPQSNRPDSTQLNIGLNNANFNAARHEQINSRYIQSYRIQQIRNDFNSNDIQPKDMTVIINGRTYHANPRTSDRAPIYQGVSNQDVQAYYMQIAGIQNMPSSRPISGRKDIYGNPAQVWSIKPTQGPLAGATINLRTYSNTQKQSMAKYTIEIIGARNTQSGIKSNRIEIKFEK